jgi:release factor glutamine methyltransferase
LTIVADFLRDACAMGVDRLDAQLLLARHLHRPRTWLLAHDDAVVADTDRDAVVVLLRRRAAGEPLAYLLGEREFHGLLLQMTPDVLVPRPDTEILVDWALELLAAMHGAPRVLDLGTGSGAIALALKHDCPRAHVHASDASAAALAIARANGERLALPVCWHQGDWWKALEPAMRFDLVVSNPPYVAPGDPHLHDLRHEPMGALVAHPDGLAAIADIVRGAPGQRLHPNGWLLIEHGCDQASAVCEYLLQAGFTDIETRRDLAGRPRVSAGKLTRSMN